MTRYRSSLGLLLVAAWATPLLADWPTFRGSDRTGISSDTGLIARIPDGGPALLFSAPGAGNGYASPAIQGKYMVTLGDAPSSAGDNDEYLSCFDANTGAPLWSTKTGKPWDKHRKVSWNGSRSTPTIDGDMVYVITPYGQLYACRLATGKIIWQRHLVDQFSGKKKDSWGYSESPLVDGDKLICTPGGPKATVIALNKRNGRPIWTCSRPQDPGAGHSSAVISHVGKRKVYVQNTGGGPLGIDAATGKLLWDYDINPPTAFIPSPIISGEQVFTVAGYGTGGALLEQSANRRSVNVREQYGLKTSLGNKHGGVLLIDGKLYFGKEDRAIICCADMESGNVLWSHRARGKGSVAVGAADGKIFLRYQNGLVEMIQANSEAFTSLGSFSAPGSGSGEQPSWAHPIISAKRLYLRENDTILCYDIAEK